MVGITDASGTIPYTSANSSIQSYAKVYIDTSRYKVTAWTNSIAGTNWNGTITVKSYIDDDDYATETFDIELFDGSDNQKYTEWVKQSVEKAMANREATDLSIVGLFSDDVSLADFRNRLKLYSLDNLSVINNMATSAITAMVELGVADADSTAMDVYRQLYAPYLAKSRAVSDEMAERELQLSYLLQPTDDEGNTDPRFPSLGLLDIIEDRQNEIKDALNMQSFLGDDLWEELSYYRRENEYQNPNYISDGLTDSEIIEYAQRFYEEANKEIIKSATLQHTISAPLYDFLLMPEFYGLQQKFKSGNWIHLQVDGKVYKLRLTNWTIDYDNIEDLDVEFSDVVRCGNIISDTQSILSKSQSMSTTYDYTARQADKGKDASDTLKIYRDSGIDFNKIKAIVSKGNTNIVYDDDGILLKRIDGVETLPEQARIYNNGIYITKDAWETVSTGLGHFSYVDPETGETIKTYGIIADTVIGKLILGDNLGIYSPNSTLKMDDTGFTVTAKPNEDNSDLFTIRRDTGNVDGDNNKIYETYIHVDSNGNLVISGNSIVIGGKTVAEAIDDARKVASNYLSADDSGIMVANLANGVVSPSNMQNGKNVLITSDDVKIRDGQQQLASYGESTVIGKIGIDGSDYGSNIRITKNSISGNRRGVIGYDGGRVIDGNIQTFNINIGSGGKIKEQTSPVYKTTGDSVWYELTPSHIPQAGEVFEVYAIINLNNGQEITTSSCAFNTQPDVTSEIFEWDISVDNEQYLTVNMSYNVDDTNKIRIGITDGACTDLEYKVDSFIGVVIFNSGVIEYPNFRFGSYDGTMQDSEMGRYSFNIGENNEMIGDYSFAQGKNNTAHGSYSHALGLDNYAIGDYSSVSGVGNSAEYDNQTVIGTYATLTGWDDLFVVGNGTDDSNRSNAMVLKNNGDVEFSGAVGGSLTFASKQEMITKMSGLKGQVAYSFFAQPSWTSFAINTTSTANSFGTICKMNSDVWYINFTSNETVYMAKYNVTNDTLSTKQLAFVTP